jgi:hypothetical protein
MRISRSKSASRDGDPQHYRWAKESLSDRPAHAPEPYTIVGSTSEPDSRDSRAAFPPVLRTCGSVLRSNVFGFVETKNCRPRFVLSIATAILLRVGIDKDDTEPSRATICAPSEANAPFGLTVDRHLAKGSSS